MGCSSSKPTIQDNPPSRTGPLYGDDRGGPSGSGGGHAPNRHNSMQLRKAPVFDELEALDENYVLPVIPKSDEQKDRLKAVEFTTSTCS